MPWLDHFSLPCLSGRIGSAFRVARQASRNHVLHQPRSERPGDRERALHRMPAPSLAVIGAPPHEPGAEQPAARQLQQLGLVGEDRKRAAEERVASLLERGNQQHGKADDREGTAPQAIRVPGAAQHGPE